jgi:tRNA(adenine34) deaminase
LNYQKIIDHYTNNKYGQHMQLSDETYMAFALVEAKKAAEEDEVPVGALLVSDSGQILAADHNRVIGLSDPTAHAEIRILRQAAKKIGNYRLLNTTCYVTIEPCIMCMGALVHARVAKIIFGAPDSKWGAGGSLYHFAEDSRLNHQPEVIGGICREECRALIQGFFHDRRNQF